MPWPAGPCVDSNFCANAFSVAMRRHACCQENYHCIKGVGHCTDVSKAVCYVLARFSFHQTLSGASNQRSTPPALWLGCASLFFSEQGLFIELVCKKGLQAKQVQVQVLVHGV